MRVKIRGGTPATIRIVDKIDSGTANVGDAFAHNWVKGKNIRVDSSRAFSAFVDNTVHVVATQRATAATNEGFAR